WSEAGEAIEDADGDTFVFNGELALFLEGFARGGRLIHIGFMLHLLLLLGRGRRTLTRAALRLARTFREEGRPLRNAGAFCAILFVAQLVSALALPPRRLVRPELPLGGYADVATRGQPEHLLPSQFALDDLEFIRRYAENELLYFRREEPHARTQEELIVLL